MNAILRTLIVWLALLAVPFQGFASAAMLPCAPQAHQGHHAAHTSMHHDQAPPHHCDADKHAPHDAKHGNCGACCAGVAIAPPLMALPSAGASTTFAVVLEAGHVPTVHLDHPERPPRFARA